MKKVTALSIIILVAFSALCHATTIYVQEGSAGAGSSWADAYGSLQDALETAVYDDEIWVAEGTYKPSVEVGGTGTRYQTFQMKNGVTIEGGYAGYGAADPDERDVQLYETILSSDLLGNDNQNTPIEELLDDPTRDDNCYHVFYHPDGTNLDSTAILDGFTVTAGNADDSSYWERGGGMFNFASSPTITNCIFIANSAHSDGGAMFNNSNSNTVLTNCIFTDNVATFGGGTYNIYSNPELTGCLFTNNIATNYGGGIVNDESRLLITNCTFIGNSATGNCGGIFNYYQSDSIITNCVFIGNTSGYKGGAMYNDSSVPIISNCTFTTNSADYGGGMYNTWYGSPIVTNCVLYGDIATTSGDEIYTFGNTCNPVFSYCDVADSGGSGTSWDVALGIDGGGNIDADPLFADADLRPAYNSPCIDAGDNSVVTEATDLDGLARVVDGDCDMTATVDMGAYEFDWLYVGDFAGGCDVNLSDFAVLAQSWQADNPAIDIAPLGMPDGVIDMQELLILAEHWLLN